mmetsp:Transcript_764/g.990  ORF Transcript_764/g.990 Transcript_764/m.990 type:complete len:300 (+) Transcript_764:208-1107(+)|eukprot:CAMPEP_0198141382 /NCGR_PEP_ID=MMETSP1443-20131203/4405_1 /TAXON_ID=186043 /ORGANISM="Entomoneis sp., Strain CCMP2396" /LENGTH=299 /DNA_ID=CAMNT_0043804119 /DNA_START=128 /DNA_END=1027 /DNA_ORIENTATION=-
MNHSIFIVLLLFMPTLSCGSAVEQIGLRGSSSDTNQGNQNAHLIKQRLLMKKKDKNVPATIAATATTGTPAGCSCETKCNSRKCITNCRGASCGERATITTQATTAQATTTTAQATTAQATTTTAEPTTTTIPITTTEPTTITESTTTAEPTTATAFGEDGFGEDVSVVVASTAASFTEAPTAASITEDPGGCNEDNSVLGATTAECGTMVEYTLVRSDDKLFVFARHGEAPYTATTQKITRTAEGDDNDISLGAFNDFAFIMEDSILDVFSCPSSYQVTVQFEDGCIANAPLSVLPSP